MIPGEVRTEKGLRFDYWSCCCCRWRWKTIRKPEELLLQLDRIVEERPIQQE